MTPSSSPRATPLHWVALLALLLVSLLALNARAPQSGEMLTLFVLALASLFGFWTPLSRHFGLRDDDATTTRLNAATWALMAAMFIVYGLARRAGPEEGFALRPSSLPDTPLVLPYSAYVVWLGALVCAPLWLKRTGGAIRGVLAALLIVALMGLGSFWLLARFYPIGETEILNPKPLFDALLQASEYAALALLCRAVCLHASTRRLALRALPVLLLLIWARHTFGPTPVVEDDE